MGKVTTVSINRVDKTSLSVSWRLDCTDRVGIVTGYNISYCPIASADVEGFEDAECAGPEESLQREATAKRTSLPGLRPWTHYKVWVSVLTKAGSSEPSFLVAQTRMAEPGSPPQSVRVEAMEHPRNAVRAWWTGPRLPNGPVHSYKVRVNFRDRDQEWFNFRDKDQNRTVTVDSGKLERSRDRLTGEETFSMVVDDLAFYSSYELSVSACNRFRSSSNNRTFADLCGVESAPRHVRTGIGKSERMVQPLVNFRNATEALVEWGHSGFHRGGPIKRFELNVTHTNLNDWSLIRVDGARTNYVVNLYKLGTEESWLPDCVNDSITNLYNFSIRAITIDEKEQTFNGDWSPVSVQPGYCQSEWKLSLKRHYYCFIISEVGARGAAFPFSCSSHVDKRERPRVLLDERKLIFVASSAALWF